jgi:hypothetical protein
VTWNDESLGKIQVYNFATKKSTAVTKDPAIYRTPSFSPDGNQIVYRKEGGNGHQGYQYNTNSGIYTCNVNGEKPEFITQEGEKPHILLQMEMTFISLQADFYLVPSPKHSKSTILKPKKQKLSLIQIIPPILYLVPDNKWVAFTELYKVYISPMPKTGQPIGLSAKTKSWYQWHRWPEMPVSICIGQLIVKNYIGHWAMNILQKV